jgi:hypothetical protein
VSATGDRFIANYLDLRVLEFVEGRPERAMDNPGMKKLPELLRMIFCGIIDKCEWDNEEQR